MEYLLNQLMIRVINFFADTINYILNYGKVEPNRTKTEKEEIKLDF
jgi:hypothetical protein